jgi:histidinol-phosphate aminotransferase
MTGPAPRPGILSISPYVGGGHSVDGVSDVAVLSANETPIGPSPEAVAAYSDLAKELHRYPDGDAYALRHAIGERFGCDPENIVCGAGSDELIALLVKSYAGPGDEVLYSRHGFLMYPISAQSAGATPVAAAEANYTTDVDAMLSKVTERTRMVFIANPNNPTGSYISSDEMRRLRDGLRDDILLVIDSAYAEYVTRNDYAAGSEMVETGDNVVMLRTFSKIFGLAALRLGWAYCPPEIAGVLHRVRGPFNVGAATQAAGVAAMRDLAHTDRSREHNDIWLPWLTEALTGLGLTIHPSVGNFVLVRFKDAATADAANAALASDGLIVRAMGGYGLPECLRITIGLESENKRVVASLTRFLAETDR